MTQVVVHPRVASPGKLRVWVGVFNQAEVDSLALTWSLDGAPAQPRQVRALSRALEAHGPDYVGASTGVFEFDSIGPNTRHLVEVSVGVAGQDYRSIPLQTKSLPTAVPSGLGESFNMLIVSCFSEPTDPSGLVGARVLSLPPSHTPDLTLLMGDQVYLDNPIFTKPTSDRADLAQLFERKYTANWTLAGGRSNGFAQVLDAAPTVSIPDDHEYWNNFPRTSVISPVTFTDGGRRSWTATAQALFAAFQQDQPDEYCRIINVEPLSIFLMDNRTFRSDDFSTSMRADDKDAFEGWISGIVHTSTIPVLVTGPSLFQSRTVSLARKAMDSNLSNYDDYSDIMAGVLRLSRAGQPVLLLSGDVHYGRVITARDLQPPYSMIHEVIASPSSLLPMPGLDKLKGAGSWVRGLFGAADVAPRWPHAAMLEKEFSIPGLDSRLSVRTVYPRDRDQERGDNVAVLSFRRRRFGVDLDLTYFMIPKHDSKRITPRVDVQTIRLAPTQ